MNRGAPSPLFRRGGPRRAAGGGGGAPPTTNTRATPEKAELHPSREGKRLRAKQTESSASCGMPCESCPSPELISVVRCRLVPVWWTSHA